MPQQYTVQQGDCLSSVADDFGFADYRTIYEDGSNADFRDLRPNPNLIYPGDVINIPDKDGKEEDRATDQRHVFQVIRSPRLLRLRLKYDDGSPVANQPYKLDTGFEKLEGSTDADGALEQRISKQAETATLEIIGVTWPLKIGHLNPMENCDDDGVSGYQARLKNLGYDPGPIDGKDGPRTQAAVRAFQEDNPPLAVDGIWGPQTKAKLEEVYGG